MLDGCRQFLINAVHWHHAEWRFATNEVRRQALSCMLEQAVDAFVNLNVAQSGLVAMVFLYRYLMLRLCVVYLGVFTLVEYVC